MNWLAENWFWVLIGVAFVAMHLFGHGGQGGQSDHGSHGGGCHGGTKDDDDTPASDSSDVEKNPPAKGHQH